METYYVREYTSNLSILKNNQLDLFLRIYSWSVFSITYMKFHPNNTVYIDSMLLFLLIL